MTLLKRLRSTLLVLVLLVALVGCGEEKVEPSEVATLSEGSAVVVEVDETTVEEGEKEDQISKKEEKIIEDLTQLGAEKYGVSVEAYTETLKAQGLTPYTAQKQLADTMGISLEDLLAYEVNNMANLTEEQKENNENMAGALEEVASLDLSDVEGLTAEALLGLKTNESGEIIILEGDVDELFAYEVKEIISTYDDEYSYVVEYYGKASVEDTVAYFDNLLKNTEEYFFLGQDSHVGAYITGRVNGMLITIAVEPLEEGLNVVYYLDKTTKE